MRRFLFSLLMLTILAVGFSLGFYFRGLNDIAKPLVSEGMPQTDFVELVTDIGSGIEQGNQVGAIASMRAFDFIEHSQIDSAKEILSIVVAHYYNTYGPVNNPKYFVGEDGKELLRTIKQFSERYPIIQEKIKQTDG